MKREIKSTKVNDQPMTTIKIAKSMTIKIKIAKSMTTKIKINKRGIKKDPTIKTIDNRVIKKDPTNEIPTITINKKLGEVPLNKTAKCAT
jgi:hypothetical protein